MIYRTISEKFDAIIEDVKERHANGQPVLIGTSSIEDSELLASAFNKAGLKHEVLNAKQHEREADIIANAGAAGAVTIATNMAGRGTDIVLGGNLEKMLDGIEEGSSEEDAIKAKWKVAHDKVLEDGGLYVLGTERHESRRIDNQLRGRSGRQGDAGETRFYLSLEDNLMRIFGSERISALMQKIGMEEGEAIESKMVSRVIENAQRKVEGHNFDIRKQLLEYDDVSNEQRKIVYEERRSLMQGDEVTNNVEDMRENVVNEIISRSVPPESIDEQWDISGLEEDFRSEFNLDLPVQEWLDADTSMHEETLRERLMQEVVAAYERKEERYGSETMRQLEKMVTLQVLDTQWKEHLAEMDYLRKGIGLRGYAQKNPKQEYKREAFEMFTDMLDRIKQEVVTLLSKVEIQTQDDVAAMEQAQSEEQQMELNHPNVGGEDEANTSAKKVDGATPQYRRDGRKVGRNEPCPCGSGKKFKACHGKI